LHFGIGESGVSLACRRVAQKIETTNKYTINENTCTKSNIVEKQIQAKIVVEKQTSASHGVKLRHNFSVVLITCICFRYSHMLTDVHVVRNVEYTTINSVYLTWMTKRQV